MLYLPVIEEEEWEPVLIFDYFNSLFHREWMEGPLGVVDPDHVEQETGNFWRSLYKSEKQFNEVPTAQKIAKKV